MMKEGGNAAVEHGGKQKRVDSFELVLVVENRLLERQAKRGE